MSLITFLPVFFVVIVKNFKRLNLIKSSLKILTQLVHIGLTIYIKDDLRLNLGELQQAYSSFSSLKKGYQSFKDLDYYQMKIKSVKQQKIDYNLYYNRLWKQRNIQEQELALAQTQFDRDQSLFENGVHSKSDYEKAEKTYLQQKLSFESSRTTLANTQMQINQLDQQVLDIKLQESQELNKHKISLQEALENLKSQLKKWEQTYLIQSPISGKITFTKIWSTNQNVQVGELVATVIPDKATNIIGKVAIPSTGVGKVKLGQTVNIKFDNFPYMEFGLLRGTVKSISLVPTITDKGAIYTAEIEIPDTLISNYGKELKFSQEMTGSAEIITDDIRLLQRFLNPLKFIWKQSVE
jgi:HlyD family secretion protein